MRKGWTEISVFRQSCFAQFAWQFISDTFRMTKNDLKCDLPFQTEVNCPRKSHLESHMNIDWLCFIQNTDYKKKKNWVTYDSRRHLNHTGINKYIYYYMNCKNCHIYLIQCMQDLGAKGDCSAHYCDQPKIEHHPWGLDPLLPLILDQKRSQQLKHI